MRFSPPQLTTVDVPDQWIELLERLPSTGRVVVVGPTDSGKTTFCWWLAEELSSQGTVVLVDADVGQSRIGPPACVGWLQYGARHGEFEFVGDVSPASRPATALAATVRMALRGLRIARPEWLIVDTTGYVDGPGAAQLKTAKIQLLAPAIVIAIAPRGRLEHLRWPWRGRSEVRWLRIDVAQACSNKSRDERQRWRQQLFAEWLAGAQLHDFDLDHIAFHYAPPYPLQKTCDQRSLAGLLVGLDNDQGVGMALGLMEDLDFCNNRVRVWAPEEAREAKGIRLGAIRLNRDGSQVSEEVLTCRDDS